jgi:hypothetical protein
VAWIHRAWLRVKSLLRRKRLAEELDGEIQFHLDELIAENIGAGMSPEEARFAAMRAFGNSTCVKEETRDAWGWMRVEQIGKDTRYALRQLKNAPGFAATAVLTLALGIGANTAIFTLVDAVMMRNLPVIDPQTLVRNGDNADCCVSGGARNDGDYTLFPTETWRFLTKNVPEFLRAPRWRQRGGAFAHGRIRLRQLLQNFWPGPPKRTPSRRWRRPTWRVSGGGSELLRLEERLRGRSIDRRQHVLD